MMMDDDDDDSSGSEVQGMDNLDLEFPEHPGDLQNDDIYGDEFGWWIVVMLRGKSTGRRLKRDIFKAGLFQCVCGSVLLSLTAVAYKNFSISPYFASPHFGANLLSLLWLVSVPTCLSGILMMLFVKYWASLVTNRTILLNLMRGTMVIMILLLASTCWCIAVLIKSFQGVRFMSTATLRAIFPAYIFINLAIYPLAISLLMYLLDVHYLTEEVELGGEIREPNGTKNAMDLSRFSMIQVFAFAIAMPVLILYQILDVIRGVLRIIFSQLMVWYSISWRRKEERKKKKGFCGRLWKTIKRLCKETWESFKTNNDAVAPAPEMTAELKRLKEEQDQADELERGKLRERLEMEIEKQKQDKRDEAERLRKEAEDKALREAEEARLAIERSPTMSVATYKSLWAELAIAGSFQCKLKSAPTLSSLTEHFKKQGFHVVFAASPNSVDCEVGISNIRDDTGTQKWFMARFLASANSFSAVMKSQDPDIVTGFVKKFALAKILKIDTAASGLKK